MHFILKNFCKQTINNHDLKKIQKFNKIQKIRVDNFGEGAKLYMEVTVVYGFNLIDGIKQFKIKAKKEIEKLTAMNVEEFEVVVKNVYVPQKGE